ncbi:hypothetical protein HPB51_002390 [Rhipicephalus microplus]|uniref:Uncharacterized protein n=1 Tax=Rhipicephalus microplus TaxID=6941 RepID=A0A9J6DSW7_RHIMP|nr:hypothetical protein HPB51_002390 [Rhipicephalus microplus]
MPALSSSLYRTARVAKLRIEEFTSSRNEIEILLREARIQPRGQFSPRQKRCQEESESPASPSRLREATPARRELRQRGKKRQAVLTPLVANTGLLHPAIAGEQDNQPGREVRTAAAGVGAIALVPRRAPSGLPAFQRRQRKSQHHASGGTRRVGRPSMPTTSDAPGRRRGTCSSHGRRGAAGKSSPSATRRRCAVPPRGASVTSPTRGVVQRGAPAQGRPRCLVSGCLGQPPPLYAPLPPLPHPTQRPTVDAILPDDDDDHFIDGFRPTVVRHGPMRWRHTAPLRPHA